MLQPLRHGLFKWYWIGQTLSAVGDGIFFATLSILILQRRDNPADLGLVLGAQSLAFAVSLVVLLPIYLSAHGSLSQLGYAYSAQAVGAVAGGVAANKIRVKEPGTAALLALLTAAAPILSMLSGSALWVLLVAMGVAGIGGSVFGVIWTTAIQKAIPSEALARVASLDYLGQLGLDPVGLAATPFAVRRFGLEPVLVASGIGLVVTTILPFAVKGVRRFEDPRADPEDAVDSARERRS